MKTILNFAAIAALSFFASCGGADSTEGATDVASTEDANKKTEAVSLVDGEYAIDPVQSTCNWKGTKITGDTHVGTLNMHKGSVTVIDQVIANGLAAVDMNSMVCTDEGMDEEAKGNLIGHLKSDDFFGVEQFPYARLEVEGMKSKEGTTYVNGKIFVREIGQPINFPVTITQEDNLLIIDAKVTFDRSKHDVKFRSGAFPDLFPDLGDKLINDDIELDVHLVATR